MEKIVNENASINFKIVPETKKVKVNDHVGLFKDFNKLDLIGSHDMKIGSFEDFDEKSYDDLDKYYCIKKKGGFKYLDDFCTKSFTIKITWSGLSFEYIFDVNLATMKVFNIKSIVNNYNHYVDKLLREEAVDYKYENQYFPEYKKLSNKDMKKAKQNIANNLVILPCKNPDIPEKSDSKNDRRDNIFLEIEHPELLCIIEIYDSKHRLLAKFGGADLDHAIQAFLDIKFRN